jgi:hypothetical protein
MFESLALEDPRNTRRRWTTAASLALEAVALGLLVLAPLGYTEAISLKVGEPLVAPGGMRSITKLADKRPPNEPNAVSSERKSCGAGCKSSDSNPALPSRSRHADQTGSADVPETCGCSSNRRHGAVGCCG